MIPKWSETNRPRVRKHREESDGCQQVGRTNASSSVIGRFGINPAPSNSDLRTDLRQLQERQREFFVDPVARAALAGLLTDLRTDEVLADRLYERFVSPRRTSVVAMVDRAAARGEIAPVEQPDLISDLLTGPLLLRTVLPAIGAIDDAIIEATVDAALNRCRTRNAAPDGPPS